MPSCLKSDTFKVNPLPSSRKRRPQPIPESHKNPKVKIKRWRPGDPVEDELGFEEPIAVQLYQFVSADVEKNQSQAEWAEECTTPPMKLDDMFEVDEGSDGDTCVEEDLCRLCALSFPNDIAVPIFDVPDSEVAKTIQQLLPNEVRIKRVSHGIMIYGFLVWF